MKLVFLTLLISSSCFASAGGVVGNGADHIRKTQAWFLGTEPFTACIEVAPDYSIAKESVFEIVKTAFHQWDLYVKNKGLIEVWPKNRPFLNFNMKMNPACQGNENIQFFFGVSNARVDESAKNYISPTAFSTLEIYDDQKGLGKGFVWVNKVQHAILWDDYNQILSLVMHELGHVYGCEHVAGTIMQDDLASFLLQSTEADLTQPEVDKFPLWVDHRRELFFWSQRGIKALLPIIFEPTAFHKELFERLVKKPLVMPLWMGFEQGAYDTSDKGLLYIGQQQSLDSGKLSGGAFTVLLDRGSELQFSSTDSKIFRSVYKNEDQHFDVPGFMIQGKIIVNKETGESIPITYSRNRGSDEYVRIAFTTKENGIQEFFRALLWTQPYY